VITQEHHSRIARLIPGLQHAESQLLRAFQQVSYCACIPAGKDFFMEGDRAEAIVLLLSGVVRVYKIAETGRRLLENIPLPATCMYRSP
jgi:hypothetical protein